MATAVILDKHGLRATSYCPPTKFLLVVLEPKSASSAT